MAALPGSHLRSVKRVGAPAVIAQKYFSRQKPNKCMGAAKMRISFALHNDRKAP